MELSTIDWNMIWKEASNNSPWAGLSKKDYWNKRADKFDKMNHGVTSDSGKMDNNDYITNMLERIETSSEYTVLDIGCGPGTLAIPLAKKVKSVTGLDISSEMLKHLKNNAKKNGLNNINFINCSWDDAVVNRDVEPHDIVIASRSLMPLDLKETLEKVVSVAKHAVYITLPIVHLPFDCEAYQAIGRDNKKHISYICAFNMLYQMGIQANTEILSSQVKVKFFSIEDAINNLQAKTDPFTDIEKTKLKEFLEQKFSEQGNSPVFEHEGFSKWALIWWRVKGNKMFNSG